MRGCCGSVPRRLLRLVGRTRPNQSEPAPLPERPESDDSVFKTSASPSMLGPNDGIDILERRPDHLEIRDVGNVTRESCAVSVTT